MGAVFPPKPYNKINTPIIDITQILLEVIGLYILRSKYFKIQYGRHFAYKNRDKDNSFEQF